MDVIVLCNACSDNTADAARRAMPWASIVEIPRSGKANAINEGLKLVAIGPVIVVDADILVNFETLACLAERLRDNQTMIASPTMKMDTSQSSFAVRAYYRVWQNLPFALTGIGGSGIYGLSPAAVERINPLPDIIADDSFIRHQFDLAQQARIGSTASGKAVFSTVFAPRDLCALVRIEARRRAGDAELAHLSPAKSPLGGTTFASLLGFVRGPAHLLDLAVYLLVKSAGRLLYRVNRWRGRAHLWWRDDSSR